MHRPSSLVPTRAAWTPWPARSRAAVVVYPAQWRAINRASRSLFGRPLQRWELAGLAGAPDGAEVDVQTSSGELYLDTSEPLAARYRTHHTVLHAGCVLVVVIEGFHIHEESLQNKGIGLRMFYRQVENAKRLGIDRIETRAGRQAHENGYYTWPRFGFDGPLSQGIRAKLPFGLRDAQNVLDLIDCEQGRLWWKEHGETICVVFDLSGRSRCLAALEKYVGQRMHCHFVAVDTFPCRGVAKKNH